MLMQRTVALSCQHDGNIVLLVYRMYILYHRHLSIGDMKPFTKIHRCRQPTLLTNKTHLSLGYVIYLFIYEPSETIQCTKCL